MTTLIYSNHSLVADNKLTFINPEDIKEAIYTKDGVKIFTDEIHVCGFVSKMWAVAGDYSGIINFALGNEIEGLIRSSIILMVTTLGEVVEIKVNKKMVVTATILDKYKKHVVNDNELVRWLCKILISCGFNFDSTMFAASILDVYTGHGHSSLQEESDTVIVKKKYNKSISNILIGTFLFTASLIATMALLPLQFKNVVTAIKESVKIKKLINADKIN
jgi:hypothetical protein